MRSVIGVSLLALLIGCGNEDAGGVFVTASWTFRSVSSSSALACPAGFTLAALHARATDGSPCNDAGDTDCVSPLPCSPGAGTSTKLLPGVYEVWLAITNDDASATYTTTTSDTLDLSLGDKAFARQILTDGGVFKLAWKLKGSDGTPRTCEQGTVFGVVISAVNEADPSSANTDEIDCDKGSGYSYGYAAGTYTVSFEAVNDSGQTRGLGTDQTGRMIVAPNGVTDLGTVEIPLAP